MLNSLCVDPSLQDQATYVANPNGVKAPVETVSRRKDEQERPHTQGYQCGDPHAKTIAEVSAS